MLRLRRKSSGGVSTRAALASGAAAAALALSAIGAGSASATVKCSGENITGAGSSLQKIGQEVWKKGFEGTICNSGSHPTISYNSIGSGAGLKEWNSGLKGSINTGLSFIGTDDAPNETQMKNIKSTAGAAQLTVIPVAQTAITIVANPPVGCPVEQISNPNLTAVFEGRIAKWNQLENLGEEEACNAPITRVVRSDGSGTTFQTKNYLFQLYKKGLFCTEGATEGKLSWQEMEPVETFNTVWPESCPEKTLSTVKHSLKGGVGPEAGSGGGDEVKTVNETAGSIGYAALPDAKANAKGNTRILNLQNNGQKTGFEVETAEPATVKGTANCGGITYTGFKLASGLDVDWSSVFGARPAVGGTSYPLCTLTYDLAWHGYKAAGFLEGQATTAIDFLNGYLVQETGQEAINSNFYSRLPTSAEPRFDVLGAAQKAAKSISYLP
jgi:ABC-type phosphate transport system substrate-binding protein